MPALATSICMHDLRFSYGTMPLWFLPHVVPRLMTVPVSPACPTDATRCGGRLLMADVGLSRAIAGHAAALVCSDGGDLRAVYAGGKQQPLPLQEG